MQHPPALEYAMIYVHLGCDSGASGYREPRFGDYWDCRSVRSGSQSGSGV